MSNFGQFDYGLESKLGNTPYTVVQKFGRNDAVGTTFEPVTQAGVYRTPQVAGATTLRIKAGNANDAVAGTGARKVIIVGIDATGAEVTEELSTAGASASTPSGTSYIRLHRAYVSESGTYATSTAGSHAADVVIENSAGTEDWAVIAVADFPAGQTEAGVYTIPSGKSALVHLVDIHVETSKPIDLAFFKREGVLDTAAPYQAMRTVLYFDGLENSHTLAAIAPLGPFPAGTDIGFMAKVAVGTSSTSVSFDIWLYDA